jgi:glycosyltransferase involved in cell wall biosynthesis
MKQEDQQLNELIQKYEGAWCTGYAAFPALVHELGLRRGAEVGVAFGGHAGAILERGGVDKLYGVDRYRHMSGYDDPMNLTQPVFDRLAQRVVERLAPYGDRFELIREDSASASARFEDGALDFVYLDADHSAAGVMQDLCHWAVKVRDGGIVAGHDYGHRDFPGVKQSVDKFFGRFGWRVHELGNGVWYVKKQALPISFFSPCYNCAKWIRGTAQSVLDANLRADDEYLLINDGATDGTANMLDELETMSPSVRVINHDTNLGGGAARNTAVRYAKHRLLVCLDSDNRLPAGLADAFRRHLLCSDAEVVVPQTIRFFRDEQAPGHQDEPTESHRASYPSGRAGFADYLGRGGRAHAAASGGNLLFTRTACDRAGGFPNDAGALDAWGFGLRLAGTDAAIDVVPGTYYWHRCGHDSYWTRHRRDGTMGRAATELIKPFLHRVHEKDRQYILGKGRDRWYFERGKRRFRTAPPHQTTHATGSLRQRLAALRDRVSPAARRLGERDTSRLRLVLGLGRSGTTWSLEVLAQCDDRLRVFAEPLHHLRPKIALSDSPDRLAMHFADALSDRHDLMRAYADLSADHAPPTHPPSGALRADIDAPEAVLIKEVHALLATPAVLNGTRAKAVVITRDPMRVADSIFNCQGLDSPYLHHEFAACADSRLLHQIGTPAQTTRRLAIWNEIDRMRNPNNRRVYAVVWAAAVVQRLLERTAQREPGRVITMAYEHARVDPIAAFGRAAAHLGLRFGEQAEAFCEQTRSRDESLDPYSIYRAQDKAPAWRVLTDAQRATATALLEQAGLAYQPGERPASHEPLRRSA